MIQSIVTIAKRDGMENATAVKKKSTNNTSLKSVLIGSVTRALKRIFQNKNTPSIKRQTSYKQSEVLCSSEKIIDLSVLPGGVINGLGDPQR